MIGVSGGFTHGFIASFMVMIVSEIGDKTFFIAAIMVSAVRARQHRISARH
jgi:putative Ca2+/H+ antiporter (TMEM165/GDT1 family)